MINMTSDYIDAIRAPSRRISYKVAVGSVELTGEEIESMEVEYSAGNDDCVGIGSTIASKLNLSLIRTGSTPEVITLQKIVPYVGIEVNSEVQWVKLGEFYPVPAQTRKTDLKVSAECYDEMPLYDGYQYTSALEYPSTVGDVTAELQDMYGVTILIADTLKGIAVPSALTGSVRGVFSAIGVLTGTFCMVTRNGEISFKTYTNTGFELTAENYSTFSLTSDDESTISGLKCIVEGEEENTELMAGDAAGVVIEIAGSYITEQTQLDEIYGRCLPVTYQPYTLELQGMPHIEAGDIVSLTDKHGVTRALYVVNHRIHLFGGGLKSEFTAGLPDAVNGTAGDGGGSGTFVGGGLIQQVRRLAADMVEAKKVFANTVTADWIKSNYISATDARLQYARIDRANIDEAWVNDLLVHGKFLTNDVDSATGSFSKYLTGVKILGDLIEANTLKANTLILQGEDGIYRRLNIDALGQAVVDSDPKYNQGLDGSILVKKSITADRINFTDLFGQNITTTGDFSIGGKGALVYNAAKDELGLRVKNLNVDVGGTFINISDGILELRNNINNIQVGGRNLLQKKWAIRTATSGCTVDNTEYVNSGKLVFTREAVTNKGFRVTWYEAMEPDTDYVVRFKAKVISGTVNSIAIHNTSPNNTLYGSGQVIFDGVKIGTFNATYPIDMSDGEYHDIELRFKSTSEIVSGSNPGHGVQFQKGDATEISVEVIELKWEKGTKATGWTPAPEDVNLNIDAAGKTATDFVNISGNGAVFGNLTGDTLGKNAYISPDGFHIRDGEKVLSRFTSTDIDLGMTAATNATINMLGGVGRIYTDDAGALHFYSKESLIFRSTYNNWQETLMVDSAGDFGRVSIKHDAADPLSGLAWPCASMECTYGEGSYVNSGATNRPAGFFEKTAYKRNGVYVSPYGVDLYYRGQAINETKRLSLDSEGLKVVSKMFCSDAITLENNKGIRSKSADGTELSLLYTSSADNINIGYGGYSSSIGETRLYGNSVHLYSNDAIYSHKSIVLSQGYAIRSLNTNGDKRTLVHISDENTAFFGYGMYEASEGITTLLGNNVYINTKDAIRFRFSGTNAITINKNSSGLYVLTPSENGGASLGYTDYRWAAVNANILRTYDTETTSNGVNARIYSNRIYRYSSSSERYKHDIAPIEAPEIAPERLYDAEVVQFKYNDGYLMKGDTRNDAFIPGFIVEKLAEIYPIAIDYNEDGSPEMWNANIMLPAILKLVQDQHVEIEKLKKKVFN